MSNLRERLNNRLTLLRESVTEREGMTKILVRYVLLMLVVNTLLIFYTVLTLIGRMTSGGMPLLDSLPLLLYILPLIVILFSILRGYYLTHVGLGAIFILLITGLVFGLVSILVRGFIALAILDIAAVIIIPLVGTIRAKTSWRDAGRKGIAWIIILNVLGAGFPAAVYVMGQSPIASVDATAPAHIGIDIPLLSNNTPTNKTIQMLESAGVEANLHLFDYLPQSWESLTDWLSNMSGHNTQVSITISPDRENVASSIALGSNALFASIYNTMSADIDRIRNVVDNISTGISKITIMFDLRLSSTEWNTLMTNTRTLNIMNFAALIRATVDSTDHTAIQQGLTSLLSNAQESGFDTGVVIDTIAFDDYLDGDGTLMLACGMTPNLINNVSRIEVDASRTKFSNAMLGDVGEYLVFSYARTMGSLADDKWSLRLGTVDPSVNSTGYRSIEGIGSDMALAGGCGVQRVTIESLQGLIALGDDALSDLTGLVDVSQFVPVTYTFRIYAFRAVTLAIDSFDGIMF
ncbi:MAG: hypothetical protein K9W43_12115 [Candidatus Thorarchaeota archaeon]|nr:hypothetical protein [Candidatus Thorarchaeota archaeon]